MNLIKNLNVTEINTALLSLMDYIKKIENATEKEEQKIESSSSSSSSDFSELTVPLVGGSGEVINSIEQTDGKITATTQSIDTSVEQGSSNPVASGAVYTALNNKIESLDVASVGGSGKYISAISETDGKISATASNLSTSVTSGSNAPITSGAVYTAIDNLDVASVGGSGKYLESISESDGKISATAQSFGSVASGETKAVNGGSVYSAIATAETNAKNLENAGGVLAIEHGGTNATDVTEAEYNIIGSVQTVETEPDDNRYIALRNQTVSSTNGTFRWTKCSSVWNWIKSKIQSVALTIGSTASAIAETLYGSLTIKNSSGTTTASISQNGNISTSETYASNKSNASSWWTSTAPRGKFIGTDGGTSSGWSPLLAGKTVAGKYEFGSLNNTLYLNYYKDTRTSNAIDKTIFTYTQDGRAEWKGNSNTSSSMSVPVNCSTASGTSAKTVTLEGFNLVKGARLLITMANANTVASAITMNVNGTGAKTIRWNGTVTSASAYAMTADTYACYYDGTYWCMDNGREVYSARTASGCSGNSSSADYTRGTAYCSTASGTQAKVASMRGFSSSNFYGAFIITFTQTNTYKGAITLNVNSTGAKPIYINGRVSSSTNYDIDAGSYLCSFNGDEYYIDTMYQVYSARNSSYSSFAEETNIAYKTYSIPTSSDEGGNIWIE